MPPDFKHADKYLRLIIAVIDYSLVLAPNLGQSYNTFGDMNYCPVNFDNVTDRSCKFSKGYTKHNFLFRP